MNCLEMIFIRSVATLLSHMLLVQLEIFSPYIHYWGQFFTTIRWQIWHIFDPSPPKKCRRLKSMVPNILHYVGRKPWA